MSPLKKRQPIYRKTPESREGKVILLGLFGNKAMIVPRIDTNAGSTIFRKLAVGSMICPEELIFARLD
jgi:hypothetical protein